MTRLRSFHIRASRYGGQVAASAWQARVRFAASARPALMTMVFVASAGGAEVLACPLCFGAQETSLVDGTKLGVLVLVGITLVVQGAFVAFFLYLRRRAKRMAELELESEWSELQRARTS